MTDNSPAGLTLLAPDRTVVGTRGEFHRSARQAYAPLADGRPRNVVVELAFTPIEAEHQRGRRGIEIRLDGERVGELTAPTAALYGPLLEDVLFVGGRPACIATVVNGPQGAEVELRLPVVPVGAAVPPELPLPVSAGAFPVAAGRRTPVLIGAGLAALLIVIGVGIGRGGDGAVETADGGPDAVATTTTAPAPPSTASATTVRRAPAAAPPERAPAPTPQPASEAGPDPSDGCDTNHADCLPDGADCDDESGEITGTDVHDLDPDDEGTGCD